MAFQKGNKFGRGSKAAAAKEAAANKPGFPAIKFTISGSLKTASGEVVDFSGVSGIMPANNQEKILSTIKERYAIFALQRDSATAKHNVQRIVTLYLDSMTETAEVFSFVGKDVKIMDWNELQDMAVMLDSDSMYRPRYTDIRTARDLAYKEYVEKVLKKSMPAKYNFADLKSLNVEWKPITAEVTKVDKEEELKNEFMKD